MKRGGPLKAGKKTLARRVAISVAVKSYFDCFGYDLDGEWVAPCQRCGQLMVSAVPHHKTPRSELLKAGTKNPDAPHRLLMIHDLCHRKIHGRGRDGFGMGRPVDGPEADEFKAVETSPVNAETGGIIRAFP